MPRSKNLNMELRSFILQHAIRQEHLTADILRYVFRILKNDTKAFGNSGSAISFQNKIDFLFDLGEIGNQDYKHFKKILELRNQFAHNPRCISFEALSREKIQYTNYLSTYFPNEKENSEESWQQSYISLFKHCHGLLCKIKKLYLTRLRGELERWQSYELLNSRFHEWFNDARKDLDKIWTKNNLDNSIIEDLKMDFFETTLIAFKHKYFSDLIENENNSLTLWKKVYNKLDSN